VIREKVRAHFEQPLAIIVAITVRNVGLAPAVRLKFVISHPDLPLAWTGTYRVLLTDLQTLVRIRCALREPAPDDLDMGAFAVSGRYLDRSLANEGELIVDWGTATAAAQLGEAEESPEATPDDGHDGT
jgi:hypothetical protein